MFHCHTLTCMLQICRFFSPSFGGRMASAFSLIKSRSLYLVIGPMWQKFILLTIPHYSKIDWPMTLFCPRSPPFMSSNGIFLQAKWSKIKERVEGWKSGKKMWFERITVCLYIRCVESPSSKNLKMEVSDWSLMNSNQKIGSYVVKQWIAEHKKLSEKILVSKLCGFCLLPFASLERCETVSGNATSPDTRLATNIISH